MEDRMTDIFTDLRLAFRSLLKSPGHALLATLILATGLALTLLMASVINAYVLKPLPFAQSQRLMHLWTQHDNGNISGVLLHDLLDWRERQTSFTELAGLYSGSVNLSGGERPLRFDGCFTTANLFEMLQVEPILGRTFVEGEDDPDAPLVAILGYNLWRNQFAADAKIIGTTVRTNGMEAEVVGVMPAGFGFPLGEELWLPLRMDPAQMDRDQGYYLEVFGRLRDQVSIGQARAELRTISEQLAQLYPETNQGRAGALEPLVYRYVDTGMRSILLAMLGCVFLVLVIACSNVANLVFVRIASRERETAVRVALGAGRWRLLAPVLAECLVISVTATIIGFMLAQTGARALFELLRISWEDQPYWTEITIDWRILVFVAGAALITTLMSGLIPALRASSSNVRSAIGSAGRGISGNPLGRLSRGLVVAEIALSCVVLVCAGLMVRTVLNLNKVDLGADTSQVLAGRIGLFDAVYAEPEDRLRLYESLVEGLDRLPGVESAALSTSLPGTFASGAYYEIEGQEAPPDGGRQVTHFSIVTPGYFELFRVPTIAGRSLRPEDRPDSQPVAVISELMAEQMGGSDAAVGKRLQLTGGTMQGDWFTVVGVVPTVVQDEVNDYVLPVVYLPVTQADTSFISIAMRTHGDPLAHAELLQQTVMELDPDLPVYWLQSLDDWIGTTHFIPRLLATMFLIFAGAGLILAAVGLYGVLAYTVVSRTQELGVRRALGASSSVILRLLLHQGTVQLAIGLASGLVIAALFARLLSRSLFGVTPFDSLTFGVVIVVTAATATIASVLPARHALTVEPAVALRHDT
jgi:predicted permease